MYHNIKITKKDEKSYLARHMGSIALLIVVDPTNSSNGSGSSSSNGSGSSSSNGSVSSGRGNSSSSNGSGRAVAAMAVAAVAEQ